MSYDFPLTWTVDRHPSERTVQGLRRELVDYNVTTAAIDTSRELAVLCRDTKGTLMGGVVGTIWGGCLEINYLWVYPNMRANGYGSRLLLTLEQEAKLQRCHTSLLDTFSFQAPGFYRRLGYEVFGMIDGYPSGYKKYFLSKHLA